MRAPANQAAPERPPTPGRARIVTVLAVLLAVGGLLRFDLAARRGAWIDEVYRITWAKGYEVFGGQYDVGFRALGINARPHRTHETLATVLKYDPPLTALLLNRWMRVTGRDGDLALRIPLVVCGLLTILGTSSVAARLYGVRAGLVAAALLTLSPFHVYYAGEINNYSLAALCVVLSYVFYYRWLLHGRWRDAAGFAIAATAGFLSHSYALIVLASQALGVLAWHRSRFRAVVRTALPFLAVAVVLALYLPVMVGQLAYQLATGSGPFGGFAYLWERLLVSGAYPWLGELTNHVPTWARVAVLALGAWLFLAGLRAQPIRPLRHVLAVNAVAPVILLVAAYAVLGNNQYLWPRYTLFFTFALYIPAAAAWAPGVRDARRSLAATVMAGLMAAGVSFLFLGVWQRDWPAAAAIVTRHGAPEDGILVHLPNLTYALGRYLRTGNRMFGLHDAPTLPLGVEAAMDGEASLWTVFAWNDGHPLREKVSRLLSCHYPFRDDFPLYGIALARYHDGRVRTAATSPTECGPDNGFLPDADACLVEWPAEELVVRGWVDVSRPAPTEVLVDGDSRGAVELLPPVEGVDAPPLPDGELRLWFEKRLDLRSEPAGTLLDLGVRVGSPDGGARIARQHLLCLKRGPTPVLAAGDPSVLVGTLSAPVKRRRFRVGERIVVHGWVMASRGVAEIAYRIDGHETKRSRRHGFARPDVAAAFPNVDARLAGYSGFADHLDTAGLAPGRHTVTVAVVHPDGTLSDFGEARGFHIVARPSAQTGRSQWRRWAVSATRVRERGP